jgi:hypothetical protein
MIEIPGAEQDARSRQKWLEQVRSKHRLFKFAPPAAACKCGFWQRSAPPDMGVIKQRDFLLDEFLVHQRLMRAEKKKLRAEAKA